ncbi:hypothetical protein [Acinetobacter indicus]|uniref:hypothetical protein n=1 Tax=Acinetobacter indicus TaxID=756892 RepID=UPI0032B4DF0C
MELIELLGGYERAKHEFEMIKEMKPIYPGEIETNNRPLLEYRRQHNIFEENDKIVFVDNFMHGELMTVAWTRVGEVWMDDGAKRCTELTMIRHATDDEIAVGHRIDGAKDLDDGIDHCSDIRNHIGPNVVVIEK